MAKRMLIDATHPEETRVVVISGKRLEEFDFETASKKQLKGNIYLAKVTRVEPSLQAAFVEYGGNRHGFLAFNEIHPDYYRIPVADRQALLAEEAAYGRRGGDDEDSEVDEGSDSGGDRRRRRQRRPTERAESASQSAPVDGEQHGDGEPGEGAGHPSEDADADAGQPDDATEEDATGENGANDGPAMALTVSLEQIASPVLPAEPAGDHAAAAEAAPLGDDRPADDAAEGAAGHAAEGTSDGEPNGPPGAGAVVIEAPSGDVAVETVGGDEIEEVEPRRARVNRRYKIQEVIKRRQIMLVQVTKEERGNKGAALTTYLSLAGRYCVLMPNTARGGGVSRKITSAPDRKRLKVIIEDLEIPQGMAVIVRTAGSERNKTEIKRDYEYLLRLWDEIRELTLRSVAPALVYEEANLIKRSIRDLYSRDIDDITVEGEEGYKLAKAFMRMLTPSHAKRVQAYRDPSVPLFQHYQVESQLDAIHNPVVHLKSGGYIVINSTEALVAIDVNSGRSTRERNIEETALRTNLEASDEVARQLRLRDLAGLIVIDYIDMEESRHNAMVERRLKEAMRHDRARIQLGRISHFGLLELSRQRLRPSLFESSMEVCRHCHGTGHIRSVESTALHVLRSIEEEGMRHRSAAITVAVPTAVALYIFNQKRFALGEVEARHGFRVYLSGDDTLIPPEMRVERIKALEPGELVRQPISAPMVIEEEPEEIVAEESEEEAEAQPVEAQPGAAAVEGPAPSDENGGRGRRRSRRRGRRDGDRRPPPSRGPDQAEAVEAVAAAPGEGAFDDADASDGDDTGAEAPPAGGAPPSESEGQRRRRRRGKRGGRRRSRRPGEPGTEGGPMVAATENGAGEQPPYDYDDDYPAPSFEPSAATPVSETAPPETAEQPTAVPEPAHTTWPEAARPAALEPAPTHQPAEEPAAHPPAPTPAPTIVGEHREVNGSAMAEDTPAPPPAAPPPIPDPAAPPRRGWWKRLVE